VTVLISGGQSGRLSGDSSGDSRVIKNFESRLNRLIIVNHSDRLRFAGDYIGASDYNEDVGTIRKSEACK
jgi:hypothetical protein